MLNSDTKRHIDAARDVLVGVAPNPTTQIDQITYALIYKFMDDMDQAAIKAGGEPSFFTGDLEQFAWSKLMDARMGNQEKMNQYGEALVKFSEAKQLPELFRTIFRSAFLPYRSPETLGLFLKEISYFDYTHPEELGNAYEYLLSIMSSQGDAGQFRTPRHIIDFIVDVLNPTKDDKVLDPACGTGGFLVSTYNHILEQHDGKNDPKKKEKPLTPDERKKLMANLEGYDIDPTMVRIAQVNMYLHQFKNPQIFQYDSLTSEDRWNDKFDVILANPPFMSPKGGIKPHNKFGVASNRSEVLFVDYIVNHLRPKGRAGIIVPEGIIFQSGVAYKALRKNLVENGLYAVVSLPGGVFQPYSGVKTSILLFNNELAKQKSEIAFVKISADGFDLGSTKKAVSQNDLPAAVELLHDWAEGKSIDNPLASFVRKEEISTKGDYNLSGDRYKVGVDYSNSKWAQKELSNVLEVQNGYAFDSKLFSDNRDGVPLIRIRDVNSGLSNTFYSGEYDPKYLVKDGDLLIGMDGDFKANIWNHGSALLNQRVCRLQNFEGAIKKYVFYLIQSELSRIQSETYAVTVKHISSSQIQNISIPLPPLDVQEQIVSELDGYAAIVSGAKQIVSNWKPSFDVRPEWAFVDIGSLGDFVRGPFGGSLKKEIFVKSGFAVYEQQHAIGDIFSNFRYFIDDKKFDEMKRFSVAPGDLIMSCSGTFGKLAIIPEGSPKGIINQALLKIQVNESVDVKYLKYVMESPLVQSSIESKAQGTSLKNVPSVDEIKAIEVPLPNLNIQKKLVAQIEAEHENVKSAKQLIETYEARTQAVIARLWSTD